MRTIRPLNGAESLRVGRNGDTVTLESNFSDGTTKTATVSAAALVGLEMRGKISGPLLTIQRRKRPPIRQQRPIDSFYISIGGNGPSLVVVSRAALLGALGLNR